MSSTPKVKSSSSGHGQRGIGGPKWTAEEEIRLNTLWSEFRCESASRYAIDVWQPISERMPGRKPGAIYQKAYRMGLLSGNRGMKNFSPKKPKLMTGEVSGDEGEVEDEDGEEAEGAEIVERIVTNVRPENKWKHDRNDPRGKAWRMQRHDAKERWASGFYPSNLQKFCVPCCELCEEEERLLKAKK